MRYRKSCVTGLEASSDASRVVGTGWSIESCTGGKSADSVCDGSGNAATTIDSGLSEAAVVSVAVPAAGSAAVATSALATAAFATTVLATTALPIAIACGSSASLALAARAAARSSIGTASVFSVPAEPKPASQPTMTPARTSDPQNAGATVVNRRGFIIPASKGSHRNRIAQPSMRTPLIVRTRKWPRNGANRQVMSFSRKCCLCATAGVRPANARSMGYDHHKAAAFLIQRPHLTLD